MLASFPALFDSQLLIAGLTLVVISLTGAA